MFLTIGAGCSQPSLAPKHRESGSREVQRCTVDAAIVVWEFAGNKVESRLCRGVETGYRYVTKTPTWKFGSAPARRRASCERSDAGVRDSDRGIISNATGRGGQKPSGER